MIRLHGFFRSSSTHRCRIALNLKGLAYDTKPVNLRNGDHQTEAFKVMNPHQAVPVLAVDKQVITQSLAIMEWLEERHPEPALLPTDTELRALVRAASQLLACDIQPLHNLRVLNYLRRSWERSESDISDWCRHWIHSGLSAFEQMIEAQGTDTGFAFGDSPGMADACLAPQLFAAKRFALDVTVFPRISRFAESYATHSAFVAAEPANQPDAA